MSRSAFIIISVVLFVVGLILVFGSVSWGSNAANTYLRSQGGSMDTTRFAISLEGYINMYRWIGSILSVTGALGFIKAIELR